MAKSLLQTIIVNQPIAGLNLPYTNCTTLLDVLTALAASVGGDVSAVGGVYDAGTESLVITLSNGGTFSIPVAALLPVVADGTTIMGNGTTADPLVGYAVTYDVATREITIATAAGVVSIVPAPSALNSVAVDTFNLLGGGVGSEVSIQQLLDLLVLQVQGATIELPFSAFADPAKPTEEEAQGWIDSLGQRPAGTIFIYGTVGNGSEDPDYVWIMDDIGDAINVESPVSAADSRAIDTNDLLGNGAGSSVTVQAMLDALGLCCPGPVREVPFSAFADPAKPTEEEAQGWIDSLGQQPAGTIFIYGTDVTGNEDPDYVWIMDDIGDAINVESPVALGEGTVGVGGPPVPYNPRQAAFFLDPATGGLYVWSPSSTAWFGPYLPN